LTDLWKWFTDEPSFIQDNRTKSGGKTVLLPGFQIRFANKSSIQPDDLIKWSGLKTVVRKWHKKLAKVRHSYP
jgi:THO complex subunit 2